MGTNQRSEGQRVIGIAVTTELDEMLAEASWAAGETTSQFIRKAIVTALRERGYPAELSMAAPPPRAGKGGRPTHKKTASEDSDDSEPPSGSRPKGVIHNETPNQGQQNSNVEGDAVFGPKEKESAK
jgi:hypothetical protein